MANYDQSGNPLSDRNASQGGQQGGYASGQAGGRPGQSGQQSQYAAGQGQGQGRGMQQPSGRVMSNYGAGSYPDLYGFGAGPFALISRLSDEMDRLFDGFGLGGSPTRSMGRAAAPGGTGQGGLRSLWSPHIEVAEREGKLLIQADLPGVRKEDVDVQIEQDAIVLQGQRHQESQRNEQGFYHSERSYGSFYRVIPLPEGIDAEQANATFRDGVLRVEVPMPQQRSRGRRLEIRDDSSSPTQQTAGQATAGQAGGTQHGTGSQPGSGQMGSTERR